MSLTLFPRRKPRKFSYVPRHYDKDNQKLIFDRMGDAKFAQNYVLKKKKGKSPEQVEEEKSIDFTSYRARPKWKDKKSPLNMFLIIVMMILVMLFVWVCVKFMTSDIIIY